MTQDTKVDWGAAIEAVHEDGRVVPMEFDLIDRRGNYQTKWYPGDDSNIFWNEDGSDCVRGSGWRIRNVPTPTNEVRERMEALVRRMRDQKREHADYYTRFGISAWQEACEIAALLDPVDGDEAVANGLVGPFEIWGSHSAHEQAQELALAAIKRGRALAEAGK